MPVAPPVFAYWLPMEHLRERLGPVRLVLSGSAPLASGADRRVRRRDRRPRPPGLRPHRGVADRHLHAVQRARRDRLGRRGPARHRDPAARRRRPRARGRRPGRDLDPRRQPLLRLLARRRRTAPTRTAGGAPATSASSTPTATCSWSTGSRSWSSSPASTSTRSRSRTSSREVDGVARRRRDRRRRRATGEAVVAYVVSDGGRRTASRTPSREHCAERLARFKQPSRIEVVDELPLTVTGKVQKGRLRAARAAPHPGAARATPRRHDRPRHPRTRRPGCHLCDDAREVVARVCADLGES